MRFVFVVFSDRGHLNPMIATAQHLERGGHEVVVHSLQEDVSADCGRAGLRARCVHVDAAAIASPKAETGRSVRLAQRLANPSWLRYWMSAVLLDPLPVQVSAVHDVLLQARPDVVVADAMAYAGPIAAERAGLLWASVATGLQSVLPSSSTSTGPQVMKQLAPARDQVLADLRAPAISFRESDAVSPWLNAVFAYPGLFEAAGGVFLLGPALPCHDRGDQPVFPFDSLPRDRPIVYVSFGSHLSPPAQVYLSIVSSLAAHEAFFVVALKDLLHEPFVTEFPPHAFPVEYAPQLAVLERASLMVSHGGVNSVMECLSAGKPMLLVPLAYDQPIVADLIESAGLGRALLAGNVTTESCRALLVDLLRDDAPERIAAASMPARCGNGAARLAELLVRLATQRAPLRADA